MKRYSSILRSRLSRPTRLTGERAVNLYLYKGGGTLNIHESDFELLSKAVTTNHAPGEGRSIYVDLRKDYHCESLPFKLNTAQIKGGKFSYNLPLKQYSGVGVCPLYYYADNTGKLKEIKGVFDTINIGGSRVGKDAVGTMDLEEAVKEFFMTVHILENPIPKIYVKYPFAYGKYLDIRYDNGNLGFEILLTNKKFIDRTKDYMDAVSKGADVTAYKIIKKRAAVLRNLHDRGFLVPFLTLDNLQVFSNRDWSILHDIGDSRFINKLFLNLSNKAFISESFWNLYYILQFNRAILPGAKGYEDSMDFLQKNKDFAFHAAVVGYFGNKYGNYIANKYDHNDVQETLELLIHRGLKKTTPLIQDFMMK